MGSFQHRRWFHALVFQWILLSCSLPLFAIAFPVLHQEPSLVSFSLPHRRKGYSLRRCDFGLKAILLVLQHDYYALRHGQSLANVAGLIASDPNIACHEYGLSSLGQTQAQQAGRSVVETYQRKGYESLVLLSSDFLRAQETAQAVCQEAHRGQANLYAHEDDGVIYQTFLRERWFGDLDGTSDKNYQLVWEKDAEDAHHICFGVESVASVFDRVVRGLQAIDETLSNATSTITETETEATTTTAVTSSNSNNITIKKHMVVCVAHGDVLQIMETAFAGIECSQHRSLAPLTTATLRALSEHHQ